MTTENTIDIIMDKDPLSLTPDDISAIVAYHRRNREAGPRPKKETGPVQKVDLKALGMVSATPANPITRRF